jgi:hypothetical protein
VSGHIEPVKTCPECAEDVREAALVCRFCGHRFAPPGPPPVDPAVFLCPQCSQQSWSYVQCDKCGYRYVLGGCPHLPEREAGFLGKVAQGFSPKALARTVRAYGGQFTPDMKMAIVMREGQLDFERGRARLLRYGEVRPDDQFKRDEIEWLLENYSEWSHMRGMLDRLFVGIAIGA